MSNFVNVLGLATLLAIVLLLSVVVWSYHMSSVRGANQGAPRLLTSYQTPFFRMEPLIPVGGSVFLGMSDRLQPQYELERRYTNAPPLDRLLETPPPICYDGPNNSITCLGQLRYALNELSGNDPAPFLDLQGAQITVRLQAETLTVAAERVFIEQYSLFIGENAPYRAIFSDASPYETASAVLTIDQRERLNLAAEDEAEDEASNHTLGLTLSAGHLAPQRLTIINQHSERTQRQPGYGIYKVDAVLRNDSQVVVSDIQVVVTLVNQGDEVVGYRVLRPGKTLKPGETLPVRLSVIPYTTEADLQHSLLAEARPT